MVGAHPADNPTPFGRAAPLVLRERPRRGRVPHDHQGRSGSHPRDCALLVALALTASSAAPEDRTTPGDHLDGRCRRRPRDLAGLDGGLYSLPLPVPDYWYEAAGEARCGAGRSTRVVRPGRRAAAVHLERGPTRRPQQRPPGQTLVRPRHPARVLALRSEPAGSRRHRSSRRGPCRPARSRLPLATSVSATCSSATTCAGTRPEGAGRSRWPTVGCDPGLEFAGADGRPGEGVVRTDRAA